MPYENVEILKISKELMMDIYKLTVQLSKFQKFEQGLQIRRSIHSLKPTIVAGYKRLDFNYEFKKFLVEAHASTFQNIDKLETVFEKGRFTDENLYAALKNKLESLVKTLNGFKQSAEMYHLGAV